MHTTPIAKTYSNAAAGSPAVGRPISPVAPGARERAAGAAAGTVAVTLHLPGPLHHRIREDAESRGESVEAWLLAEARAIFEPEGEA